MIWFNIVLDGAEKNANHSLFARYDTFLFDAIVMKGIRTTLWQMLEELSFSTFICLVDSFFPLRRGIFLILAPKWKQNNNTLCFWMTFFGQTFAGWWAGPIVNIRRKNANTICYSKWCHFSCSMVWRGKFTLAVHWKWNCYGKSWWISARHANYWICLS